MGAFLVSRTRVIPSGTWRYPTGLEGASVERKLEDSDVNSEHSDNTMLHTPFVCTQSELSGKAGSHLPAVGTDVNSFIVNL